MAAFPAPAEESRSTTAVATAQPSGIGRILLFEAAERFAFYAMISVAAAMVARLAPALAEQQGRSFVALLDVALFVLVFIGAIAAESFLGRFQTAIAGAVVATVGYGLLALAPAQLWLFGTSLALVALGTGAVKPCIAAHLGDQFTEANQHRLPHAFGWFYFMINGGALLAAMFIPRIAADAPNGLRFALLTAAGVLLVGTLLLASGRKKFTRVPAFGRTFARELFSREGASAIARLLGIYVFVVLFWTAWRRGAGDLWPLQAAALDLRIGGVQLLPEQIGAANILFILLWVPLLHLVLFPIAARFVSLTPLRKIGAGLFSAALSFGVAAGIEQAIAAGTSVSVGWQLLAWALLTLGEVLVMVSALQLSYEWAPARIKSLVMAIWLLTFAAQISGGRARVESPSNALNYYIFFAVLMAVATVIFAVVARFYRYRTYLQSQDEPMDEVEAVAPTLGGGAPT